MLILIFLFVISVQLLAEDNKVYIKSKQSQLNTTSQPDSLQKFQKFLSPSKDVFRMPTLSVNTERYNMPFYKWNDSIDYKIKISPIPEGLIYKLSQPKIKLK